MRVRILEGFARGIPMVTTSLGLEGIEAEAGKEILVADGPEAFASRVLSLLVDVRLRESLAVHGRKLAETTYDWRTALAPLSEIYAQPIADTYAGS